MLKVRKVKFMIKRGQTRFCRALALRSVMQHFMSLQPKARKTAFDGRADCRDRVSIALEGWPQSRAKIDKLTCCSTRWVCTAGNASARPGHFACMRLWDQEVESKLHCMPTIALLAFLEHHARRRAPDFTHSPLSSTGFIELAACGSQFFGRPRHYGRMRQRTDDNMRKNGQDDHRPANDNPGEADIEMGKVRAALLPLVRLLARQAARDWLDKVANDNTQEVNQNRNSSEQE